MASRTRAPELPREVGKLRDQLVVSRAPSSRARSNGYNMNELTRRIGSPYSSRQIPLQVCYEMRTDAIIQFAELVSMASLLMAPWSIECANARKAEFLDRSLRRIYGRLVMQFYMARSFGRQALVKEFGKINPSWEFLDKNAPGGPAKAQVWPSEMVEALIWEPFVPLRPELSEPKFTDAGAFNGIKVRGSGYALQGVVPWPAVPLDVNVSDEGRDQSSDIDLNHSLWVVNERDNQFGSVWGYPRTGYAYKYWRAYEMTMGILSRSVERKGDPTIVVSFPIGNSNVNGEDKDNQKIAMEIAENARSGSILVIPSEVWGDDDKGTGQRKWGIEYLKAEQEFERLESILAYLDTMKFRSMVVAEQAVTEGRGGTSSRNVAKVMGDRTAEAQFFQQEEHDDIVNRYMLPQLGDANFPELRDEPARKVTKTIGEGQADLFRTLFESYANANSDKLPINWNALTELFGIPTEDIDTQARLAQAKKKLEEAPQQTQPPEQEAAPNGAAGVTKVPAPTESGFEHVYYDARERIELSEDETLLASLPPTKHYQDRAVLAQTRLIRKLWFDLLTEKYENFAKFVESDKVKLEDVDLADGDSDETRRKKIVDAIVKGWRFTSSSYQATIKRTAAALTAVFSRAGTLELKRASMKLDDWNPDEKELADWIRLNAAAMVKKIDDTTRKQLRTFLFDQVKVGKNSKEIAAGIREHFSEFPGWRADLIAREEVRQFYNAATLFAARSAGGKQVQALDARHGPTDHECEKRNGRLYPIEAAFQEEAKEHPRGTLAWRILPTRTELSIQYLTAADAGDYAARVERESGTIYLVEGMDPATEGDFLEQVGRWYEAVPS